MVCKNGKEDFRVSESCLIFKQVKNLKQFYSFLCEEEQLIPSKSTEEFSIEKLKGFQTSNQVRAYLNNVLGQAGASGMFRAIWIVNETQIIKVMKHSNDTLQNEKEVLNAQCLGERFAPKIVDYHPQYLWILEERLAPQKIEALFDAFEKLLNHRFKTWKELKEFFHYSTDTERYDDYEYKYPHFKNLYSRLISENEWFMTLMNHLEKCNVGASDFHDENWGIRPSTGEIVLLDLGF